MITKLPDHLSNEQEITNFISELWTNKEFFHLDDDARDIVNGHSGERIFTDTEADKINKLMEQAFAVCDVWELPIISKIIDSVINS